MIKITALDRTYKSVKRKKCQALHHIDLELPDKGLVFLLGKSGSGKSTLLNLIGGLDRATGGKIRMDGKDLSALSGRELTDYRSNCVGFVFQDYHLIDELTVYENVALALELQGSADKQLVQEALRKVELTGYEDRYPNELSGGERQRVAIARAVVKNPRIILADEPTGNLDAETTESILKLLQSLSRDGLVFVVSHNKADAARYADRIISLSQGKIVSDQSENPELAVAEASADHRLKRNRVSFGTQMKLSWKFLKTKLATIGIYALLVTAIMVVMALTQTVASFDAAPILREELKAGSNGSVYLTKMLTQQQKKNIDKLDMIPGCFPEIPEGDPDKFAAAGYSQTIYPVWKYSLPLHQSNVSAGMATNIFDDTAYILEPLGTLVVDEAFLEKTYGKISYLAKAENFHPAGVIITDYLADVMLHSDQVAYASDYESLIGPYHWGTKDAYSCVSRGYINGILDTGYRERYADAIDYIESRGVYALEKLLPQDRAMQLLRDVQTKYGFCYSLNPDFCEAAQEDPAWEMVWHYALQLDESPLFTTSIPQVRSAAFYGMTLGENEVLMELTGYNKAFGTAYTPEELDSFVPHSATLRHYRYVDSDANSPLFEKEIQIVGLFVKNQDKMSGTFIAGNGIYEAFSKDHIYATGLYFQSSEDMDCVLETAEELGYQNDLVVLEGVRTMTRAVEVFVPVFRLLTAVLSVTAVILLMHFATKMIRSKIREIGILKAMGGRNSTLSVIFGLQVLLLAVLVGILSAVGYGLLIGAADRLLVESLRTLADGRIIPKLQLLRFQWKIALQNALLTLGLSGVSFIVPMLKLRASDPVEIIQSRE